MKVFVANGAFLGSVIELMQEYGFTVTNSLADADLLCLTGGGDIHPSLYGQQNVAAYSPSLSRDQYDVDLFNEAVRSDKPILGICRGAQIGCALSGGTLWQDLSHPGGHPITDLLTGEVIPATSIHHQMIRSNGVGDVLATFTHHTTRIDDAGSFTDSLPDEEVIWFGTTRCLAVQGHPEVGKPRFRSYIRELMIRKGMICVD